MSSARKRAYKHKSYAEIDSLKQELMLKSHHYDTMLAINQVLAKKGDEITEERDALKAALQLLYSWANNWDSEFMNDPDWKNRDLLIVQKALTNIKEQ